MAPIAGRTHMSAKKAGTAGSYSWGDAAKLLEFELIGASGNQQVSVAPVDRGQAKTETPPQQPLRIRISDGGHFPKLVASCSQVRKRRVDLAASKPSLSRPAPPTEAPPPAPVQHVGEYSWLDDASSLMIDWACAGSKTQRSAAFQQLFHLSSLHRTAVHEADAEAAAMMIDWSAAGTKSQRCAAYLQAFAESEHFIHRSFQKVSAEPLTMIIDWSEEGTKSQRVAAFRQAVPQEDQSTAVSNASTNPESKNHCVDCCDDVCRSARVCMDQSGMVADDADDTTNPATSERAAGEVDNPFIIDLSPTGAQGQMIAVTQQASNEAERDWEIVNESIDDDLHNEDMSYTVVPAMHVRETQTGFSVQRSRNTFARMPRRLVNAKANAAPMIDWAAEGSVAFQQAAHLGPHHVPKARSQIAHRAMKVQCKANQSVKIPNNVVASRPRRDRSRSLVTQKRGR